MRGALPAHGPPGSSLRQWPATDLAKLPRVQGLLVSKGKAGRRKFNSRMAWSRIPSLQGHYVYYNVPMAAKTQPFSIRLGEQANLLVEDEVRRSGRSRSVVVEELAEEAAKTRLPPGVAFRGRPRRAWLIGSGLDVWEIIDLLGSYRDDGVALTADHPLVSARHVRTARASAAQVSGEVEAQ